MLWPIDASQCRPAEATLRGDACRLAVRLARSHPRRWASWPPVDDRTVWNPHGYRPLVDGAPEMCAGATRQGSANVCHYAPYCALRYSNNAPPSVPHTPRSFTPS
jgi:hypothetical protein